MTATDEDVAPAWATSLRAILRCRDGEGKYLISAAGLAAAVRGLEGDDERLIRGQTTTPPPLQSILDWPVEGACLIGYCSWQGDGLGTVGAVEEHFARTCFEADQLLGQPAAVRFFLDWFDDTPRDEMRAEVLRELRAEQARRGHAGAGAGGLVPETFVTSRKWPEAG